VANLGRVAQVKKLFFDTRKVVNAMDRATRKAMSYFGGYVRKVAKNSMRRVPGASAPGTPPHAHVGLIKEHTYYAYDPVGRSVVIGPARLKSKSPYGEITVPEVEEYGGDVQGVSIEGHHGARRKVRVQRRYPERPFMRPAFEAAKERLSTFWADSVRP